MLRRVQIEASAFSVGCRVAINQVAKKGRGSGKPCGQLLQLNSPWYGLSGVMGSGEVIFGDLVDLWVMGAYGL